MKKDKIVLYMHAGSDNHGCEAIANSLIKMLPCPAILVTNRAAEDAKYSLPELCSEIIEERQVEKNFFVHTWYYVWRKLFKDPECYMRYRYNAVRGKNLREINISIGGDNYCYDNMLERLIMGNRMFHREGAKTVLYGCSIEPELLERPEILEDMKRYNLIVARESITYDALKNAGVTENVHLCPDPAFLLDTEELPMPEGWIAGKMVGLNVSPMIVDNEKKSGITLENYKGLIKHILENTDLNIALIPHVVWQGGDDRKTIEELYQAFAVSGRVIKIGDASASQLKGYISRCRMFIGARTHATIAAYSTCVPTLVVGYSVKARGIAKDLFGSAENYVLPVQTLENKDDLINAFEWLRAEEEHIRTHLQQMMPEYKKRAAYGGELIKQLASGEEDA